MFWWEINTQLGRKKSFLIYWKGSSRCKEDDLECFGEKSKGKWGKKTFQYIKKTIKI